MKPAKSMLDAMQRLRDANVPPLTEEDIAEDFIEAEAFKQRGAR